MPKQKSSGGWKRKVRLIQQRTIGRKGKIQKRYGGFGSKKRRK